MMMRKIWFLGWEWSALHWTSVSWRKRHLLDIIFFHCDRVNIKKQKDVESDGEWNILITPKHTLKRFFSFYHPEHRRKIFIKRTTPNPFRNEFSFFSPGGFGSEAWKVGKVQLKGQYQLVILGCGSQLHLVLTFPEFQLISTFWLFTLIITKNFTKLHIWDQKKLFSSFFFTDRNRGKKMCKFSKPFLIVREYFLCVAFFYFI